MRRLITAYISKWKRMGYKNGIPDEAPVRLELSGRVPSYRLICLSILKNDFTMKLLGFSRPECEIYNQLKKQELLERGKPIWEDRQLRLWQ